MGCLFLLSTAVVPAVPSSEVPDLAARRIETLFVRVLRSADEDEQYRLERAATRYFAEAAETMSSPDRRRLAFQAALVIQTCNVQGVRIEVSWLFQHHLLDGDGLPALGALLDYYEDAKAMDAALARRALVGGPTQTATGQMDVVWARRAAVQPALHIPGKRRQ